MSENKDNAKQEKVPFTQVDLDKLIQEEQTPEGEKRQEDFAKWLEKENEKDENDKKGEQEQ